MVQRNELDDSSPLVEKSLEILRTEKCTTIKELVRALEREEKSISIQEIQAIVETLERNGKVTLVEPLPPKSFVKYVTKNYFDSIALWLGIFLSALALVAIYGVPSGTDLIMSSFRLVAGGIALLFLPGYGILILLFSGFKMSSIERLAISFILSLIITLILFLLIDNLPIVAGRDPMVVGTIMIGLLLILFGNYKQYVYKQNKLRPRGLQEDNKGTITSAKHDSPEPSSVADFQPQLSSITSNDYSGSSGEVNGAVSNISNPLVGDNDYVISDARAMEPSPLDSKSDVLTSKISHSANKLAKGSYFLILDNFANLGIGAIFWLVLSKMINPATIGQAMVITGVAVSIIGFSGFGIQVALSKYLPEYIVKNRPSAARKIIRGGIRSSLIISGVIVVAVALLSGAISTYAYNDPSLSIWIVFIIATFVPTQTVTATLIGAFQGVHKMNYVAITDSIFQASRLGFAVAAIMLGYGLVGILASFAFGSFLSLGVAYLYLLPRAIPKGINVNEEAESSSDSRSIFKFTGLNYFSIGMRNLASQLGVLILGTQSFEWAAFYGLAYLIAKVVGSFSHSVGDALLPTASEEKTRGNKIELQKIANIAVRLSILVSGFGFILLMIDPVYFLTLISHEYVSASWALRILTISALINSIAWLMSSLLNASNKAFDVAKIGLISAIVTIALTFALVRVSGTFEGAAIGWLVGSAISLIVSLYILKAKEDLVISIKSIVRPFVAILSALGVGFGFVMVGHTLIGIVVSLLCFVGFSLLFRVTSRREIRGMIDVAISKKRAGK